VEVRQGGGIEVGATTYDFIDSKSYWHDKLMHMCSQSVKTNFSLMGRIQNQRERDLFVFWEGAVAGSFGCFGALSRKGLDWTCDEGRKVAGGASKQSSSIRSQPKRFKSM
jgi:hypothetical protein